jgi:hypothetical protein
MRHRIKKKRNSDTLSLLFKEHPLIPLLISSYPLSSLKEDKKLPKENITQLSKGSKYAKKFNLLPSIYNPLPKKFNRLSNIT